MANRTAARPVWDFNHVIAYGQSLSSGWEGWPALSVEQRHDSLMIGASVHGISENGSQWVPAGAAEFRPLVATVMRNAPQGEVLEADAAAALPPGANALGETVLEGALDLLRGRQLALRRVRGDGSFAGRFVASSCGVGGRSVEQLSLGAGLFNRPRMAAMEAKRLATAAGGSYGVAALVWLFGENNAVGTSGTGDRAEFVALSAKLQADFNRDVVAGIAGQANTPAVFTHQVSGIYVRDSTDLAIPMAQLDCAYGLPDWFMVGPAYPVTEKGGHLDANGYRWLGQQFGKVMHKVLDLGEGWKPLHPLQATWRGTQVLVDFHVPHPPLVFGPCYVRTKATTFADGGFSVTDDTGRIGVIAAAVVAGACVLLVLERPPGENPVLWYAGQAAHGGYGNLRDSDPTEASQAYEYHAGSGQYPGADIAELVGKPYPLWNWCVAFRVALTADPASVTVAVPVPEKAPPAEGMPIVQAPEPSAPQPEPAITQTPTPAWQVLPGEQAPTPVAQAAEPPAPPPQRGFWGWLRRLFGGR